MGSGVFLGLTTVDILNYVSHYPGSNEKVRAREQLVYAGGPAANAAVAYVALGNEVQLLTGLGQQSLADPAKDDLKKHSVDFVDLAADPLSLPVLSSITIDESTGDRSVVYSDTTSRKLMAESVAMNIPEETSVLLLDGYYLPQALQLAEQAKKNRVPVVLDGGSWKDGLEVLLPLVDYAICSANFIPPGCSFKDEVVSYLRNVGIDQVAITGGGSSIYAWENGIEMEIEVKGVEVVDTLGAGDILHGAFCHFIKSRDFFVSLSLASDIASQSCRVKGTRAWMEEFRVKENKEPLR